MMQSSNTFRRTYVYGLNMLIKLFVVFSKNQGKMRIRILSQFSRKIDFYSIYPRGVPLINPKIYHIFSISQGFGKFDYLHSSYISELESKLVPYLKYALWGDPNDAETTRMTYAKRLRCPFNFIYPPRYREQTLKYLQEVVNFSIDDKVQFHHTTDLIFNAKKMINMLAERLDTKLWFFNNGGPTEVDANIYAILTTFLNAQLSSNDIKNHIGANANLLKYIERIRSKYLSDICAKETVATNDKVNLFGRVKNVFVNKDEGTISNTTIKIIFATLALGSMIVFAISHGIVEIALTDDDLADSNELLYDEHDDEHIDDED